MWCLSLHVNSLRYFISHNRTIDATGKLHESSFTENYAAIDALIKLRVLFRQEPCDRIIK